MSPNDLNRFWSKVNKVSDTGCWLWTAHIDPHGYGRLYQDQQMDFSSRDLSKLFKVSHSSIQKIVSYKSYKEIV